MTKTISVLLHWNLDYAEYPRSEAENIIKKSYRPMINALEKNDLGPILMNITGHTLDFIATTYPELMNGLRKLSDDGKIEFVGSGYSHPILPLIPRERRISQMITHKDKIEEIFNVKLQGFWPPELAISPIIVDDISEIGYDWIYADHEHLHLARDYYNEFDPFTKRQDTITETLIHAFWAKWFQVPLRYFRAYRAANKWIKRYENPLARIENFDKQVKIVQTSVSWTNATIFSLQHTPPFFSKKKLIKMIKRSNLPMLPLYSSDIEFFGYRSHTGNAPTPEEFVTFLMELADEKVILDSPSQNDSMFVDESMNITAGSWSPDKSLKIWTDSEDNRELQRRMAEIYSQLEYPVDNQACTYLRIAENSDARGWSPINERKMEAYEAIRTIENLLNKE